MIIGLVLAVIGLCPTLAGVAVVGKNFSNSQIEISNDEFAAVAWHNLRTDEVFPDYIHNPDSRIKNPDGWSRQGIAKESSCEEAFREDLAKAAVAQGCKTALRATYVDIGGGLAATIGVGVVGSYDQAQNIAEEFFWAADTGPLVYPVAVDGTPAAKWHKSQAMAGGANGVGLTTNNPPYFVAISLGPVDDTREYRRLPGDWSNDAKGEQRMYQYAANDLVSTYAIYLAGAVTP